MAQVNFNGQDYDVPDGMPLEDVIKIVTAGAAPTQGGAQPAPPTSYTQDIPKPDAVGKINPAKLSEDAEWLKASATIYRAHKGVNFDGKPEDIADYGLNQMAWFNYNLPAMGVDAARLKSASPEEKKAFLYLMDTFDKTEYSWAGAGRFLKAAALDPTNYIGLGTFGLGAVASKAGSLASKEALQAALRMGLQVGVEGMAQAAAHDAIEQTARINADGQKDFNYAHLAAASGIGAASGFALGAVGGAVGARFFAKDTAALEGKTPKVVAEASKEVEPAAATIVPIPKAAIPDVADGHIRYYHGTAFEDASKFEGKTFLTPQFEYARDYRGGPNNVLYTDISKEEAIKLGLYDDINGFPRIGAIEDGAARLKPHTLQKAEKAAEAGEAKAATPVAETVQDPAERVLQAIRDASEKSGIRVFPRTAESTENAASKATSILAGVSREEIRSTVEALRRAAVTPEQGQLLENAFKTATNQLEARAANLYADYKAMPEGPAKDAALKVLAQVEKVRDNIKEGDTALSSMAGRTLGDRVGSINTESRMRHINEDSILVDSGIDPKIATPEQRIAAKEEYYAKVSNFRAKIEAAEEVQKINAKLDEAFTHMGDPAYKESVLELLAKRKELRDSLAAAEGREVGITTRIINDVNTYLISTVFTTSTVAINTIPSILKTIYKPALNWVAKGPGEEAAFREMVTFYHTMAVNIDSSFRAAKAAFQLQRPFYTTETYANKYLESAQGTGVFNNAAGRALCLFPRLLSATDEFFGQLNYRSFVMGSAHYDAIKMAEKAGLHGTEKQAYVMDKLAAAEQKMFGEVKDKADVLEFLREAGMERGLKGEKLTSWMQDHLAKNGEFLREASSQAGKDFAEDLLFKRQFSGEGVISKEARDWETTVQNHPWMRTIGQLFFRTPIRVFEEGIRMTPGLNLIAPHFIADLSGKNGQAAYAKAMGEAMVSYGVAQWIVAQYAMGNLTGGGPDDFFFNKKNGSRLRRDLENSGWQPYSLKTEDGKAISFRNLDPFSTPIKIIVNVLDRLTELDYRRAQGEYIMHDWKEAMAWLGVGVGSIGQAIRDANLTQGVHDLEEFVGKILDPEDRDTAIQRFLGQKAQMLIPNMLTKVQQIQHPLMADPVTAEQFLRARINPSDSSVAHQHDPLGNIRKIHDPWGSLTALRMTNPEERAGGHSERDMTVLRELAKIGVATDQNFTLPYRSEYMPGVEDLRRTMTKDGSMTLYDRVNQHIKDSGVNESLYRALVDNQGGTLGTPGGKGSRAIVAKEILEAHRKQAFMKLWQEETGLQADYIKDKLLKGQNVAGQRDVPWQPHIQK